tara:strand:- start:278 stop:2053 length:1776 start_codon:yes stop_codon:yes gene_type:complete
MVMNTGSQSDVAVDTHKVNSIKFGLVQLNPMLGDIRENVRLVKAYIEQADAEAKGPLVLLFPELVVTGYPPEDLLLRDDFIRDAAAGLEELRVFSSAFPDVLLILGAPVRNGFDLMNAGIAINAGQTLATHYKVELPNYQVFDEKRYFTPGTKPAAVFDWKGVRFGLSVCEDIWFEQVMASAVEQKAEVMLNINASPFHARKQSERIGVLKSRIAESRDSGQPMSLIYVNQIGGQDELVFDGGSMVLDQHGEVVASLARYQSLTGVLNYDASQSVWDKASLKVLKHDVPAIKALTMPVSDEPLGEVFQALVLGLSDYVKKNGFKQVLLGLSGGIDSALTLALAVAALGPDAVTAVMMPFDYTSKLSVELAETQAKTLGVHYSVTPISPIYKSVCQVLAPAFKGMKEDVTEENIQARCRGIVLMGLSNKFHGLVLTTGNKSELAVGYSTLYGDMAGGFDPIKDLPKTQVYALSEYLNLKGAALGFNIGEMDEVIPAGVITRAPSAELRPDQKDQDSLPEYEVLDGILYRFIELDQSVQQIVAAGYDEAEVREVIRKVKINEHKRRQAPPGLRLTARGFGRDRRYPIAARWNS